MKDSAKWKDKIIKIKKQLDRKMDRKIHAKTKSEMKLKLLGDDACR